MPLSTPNTPPSAPANPASRQPELRDFLRLMVKESASDLVLKAGGCPAVRVAGGVRFLGDQPLPAALVRSYVAEVLDERLQAEFDEHGAADTAFSRCRVSAASAATRSSSAVSRAWSSAR